MFCFGVVCLSFADCFLVCWFLPAAVRVGASVVKLLCVCVCVCVCVLSVCLSLLLSLSLSLGCSGDLVSWPSNGPFVAMASYRTERTYYLDILSQLSM